MNDVALFILLGQSNAVGHGIPMAESERIVDPLQNVYGLNREKNQLFSNNELHWDKYKSSGMNLGETQDDTWSLANTLALQWQKAINAGMLLPDLYIIQIAIGAQGVTSKYMWYPKMPDILIPGKLGKAKISLFSFTKHILSLVRNSLSNHNILPIGIHWRGGEEDMSVPLEQLNHMLLPIYKQLFREFEEVLDIPNCPIVLHRLLCWGRAEAMDEHKDIDSKCERLDYINHVFFTLQETESNYSVFDCSTAPFYCSDGLQQGIFAPDLVHYTSKTNHWVANEILKTFMNEYNIQDVCMPALLL